MEVEIWDVSRPIPYARNARVIPQSAIDKVAASVKEFGWRVPIVVDEEGVILAGHTRLQAAQKLGLEKIPVHIAAGLSKAQRKAYRLADNRVSMESSFDNALLSIELGELKLDGFDLDLTGFNTDELAALEAIGNSTEEGLTDEDAVPETPAIPVTVEGDLWVLGNHRIVCGDSTSADTVAKLLGSVKPQLMVTDPPCGVEYDPSWRSDNKKKSGKVLNDDRADWSEAWALFPGSIAYVWSAGLRSKEVIDSLIACDFRLRAQIIWVKDRFTFSRGDYHWKHEPCWYAVRGAGNWTGDRKQTTVWEIKAREDEGHGHGTQKPVACMLRPMENNSSPGQAVYEPFSGSGTSIIAGEKSGRCVYAIELNPAYVDVAVQRWADFTGRDPIREDGAKWSELKPKDSEKAVSADAITPKSKQKASPQAKRKK